MGSTAFVDGDETTSICIDDTTSRCSTTVDDTMEKVDVVSAVTAVDECGRVVMMDAGGRASQIALAHQPPGSPIASIIDTPRGRLVGGVDNLADASISRVSRTVSPHDPPTYYPTPVSFTTSTSGSLVDMDTSEDTTTSTTTTETTSNTINTTCTTSSSTISTTSNTTSPSNTSTSNTTFKTTSNTTSNTTTTPSTTTIVSHDVPPTHTSVFSGPHRHHHLNPPPARTSSHDHHYYYYDEETQLPLRSQSLDLSGQCCLAPVHLVMAGTLLALCGSSVAIVSYVFESWQQMRNAGFSILSLGALITLVSAILMVKIPSHSQQYGGHRKLHYDA